MLHYYLPMTATQTAIETPVMKQDGYPSEFTKFGVITEIENGRAKVQWAAKEIMGSENKGYASRVKLSTWCKIETLATWPESLRIRLHDEKVTLTASGMEYRTPKA